MKLNDIPPTDSLYPEALFLQGHVYYQDEQYPEAIARFDSFLSEGVQSKLPTTQNINNARWTRILALSATYCPDQPEQNRAAILAALDTFLASVSNPSNTYYQKAEALKSMLEEE